MAFTATLTAIDRSDTSLNVEVRYDDSATGFTILRVFSFQHGDTVTLNEIVAEVRRVGEVYKGGLATHAALRARIGDVITI